MSIFLLWLTDTGSAGPPAAVVTAYGLTAPNTWEYILTSGRPGVGMDTTTNEQNQQVPVTGRDTI